MNNLRAGVLAAAGVAACMVAGVAQVAHAAPVARPALTGVSHIAIYAKDTARSEAFYTQDLGARKMPDVQNPQGVRYHFAPAQFVEVLPLPAGETGMNRLAHVAFNTTNAEQMRRYLAAKGVSVPASVAKGSDGSAWFAVKDPEGMEVQFVQPPAKLPKMARNPLSDHIMHVGFIIHNRANQDKFYKGILGFRPYWEGGMRDDHPTWISLQLPESRDWLEYMVVGTPDTLGIPANMKPSDLGVLNHFALGVPDTRKAYTLLWNGNRLKGQEQTPKIGRDAKWQLNLLDPDGTRAEVMEFHAIGKPCCSPFRAPDPVK